MVDWKISLKKGLYVFIMGGIAAAIDYLAGFTGAEEILYASVFIAFLRVIQDAVKHWDD